MFAGVRSGLHRPSLMIALMFAVGFTGTAVANATVDASYPAKRPTSAFVTPTQDARATLSQRALSSTRPATARDRETFEATGYELGTGPSAATRGWTKTSRTGANAGSPYGALPLPCGVIANCSFETGAFGSWISTDLATPLLAAQVAPPGATSGFFFASSPVDGNFSYVNGFDGGGPGIITLAQDVILPPGAASLEFNYRAAWSIFGTLDRHFFVNVEPNGGGMPLQSDTVLTAATGTTNSDTGTLAGSVSLAAFAGQSVRIVFGWEIPESFTGSGFFELDRITVAESICGPIANCSFETGTTSSWGLTEFPVPFFPSFVSAAGYDPGFGLFTSAPTNGALALVHSFDASSPGDMTLVQDITLPAGALSVEFDYRAGWDMFNYVGSTLPRTFAVEVQPSGGGAPLLVQPVLSAAPGTVLLDTGPRTRIVDLSAYAGQAVRLVFRWNVPEQTTGPAFFQLDRIALSASACADIANCSFETGTLAGWTATDFVQPFYSQHVGSVESVGFDIFTTAPSNGGQAFILGFDGEGPDTAELMQDVTMPVWAERLRFDYRAGWDMLSYPGSTLPRVFQFEIEPAGGGVPLASETVLMAPPGTQTLDTGPVTRSVDVSAFAGQTVRLAFRWDVPEPFTGPGLFQLDHIALNSSLLDAPPSDRAAGRLTVLPAMPNPSRGQAAFRFTLPVASEVELEIVDVRGGRVWHQPRQSYAAGDHALAWDGTTTDGRSTPAGVYFARVRAQGEAQTRMFVRVN